MSELVRLRPVMEADLPVLEMLRGEPKEVSAFNFVGFSPPGLLRRRYLETGLISDDYGMLIVDHGGALAGDVGWHRVQHGPASHGWNIGIALRQEARGKGIGTRAQRLLAAYLFAHTQVNRVEATTERDNVAEQRALEKAGFTREGVVRGANFRGGAWRDMVLYSMLRSECGQDGWDAAEK